MTELINQVEGGAFLYHDFEAEQLSFPETMTEEQRLIAKTAQSFVQQDVLPMRNVMDQKGKGELERLLKKAGELGLLAHSVPERYGGLGLDKVTKGLVGEAVGMSGSYGVAHSNHTCIATLPITYFGTEEQKNTYLPKLASGEFLGAYCLTEPAAGSDALSSRTTAVLNEAGSHYILNGTKQWITNAGFSDTFIVYAKIDGKAFTAFIVEKATPGLSLGPEEHKMGIRGSSTRSVIFEDCPVPVDNILGEIGKGHVIALNVLNLGRYNLGFACLGGAKIALKTALNYSIQRQQFNTKLADFSLTQEKLVDLAVQIFASESIQHRTGGLLENQLRGPLNNQKETERGLKEHAIECAICKVFSSETLDYVVDEALQLHGGYGYMEDYEVETMYRDSRINRIFEGTNEINRLLIPGFLMKKGSIIGPYIQKAFNEFGSNFISEKNLEEINHLENWVKVLKRWALLSLGLAFNRFGSEIEQEQETLIRLANLVIGVYTSESVYLRAKLTKRVDHEILAKLFIEKMGSHCQELVRELIINLADETDAKSLMDKLTKERDGLRSSPTFNLKRKLAKQLIEKRSYSF